MNEAKSIVIMGVSGSGKTTIGRLVAENLKIPFFDADDFHPEINKQKMASGIPLTDEDRLPWLHNLAEVIGEHKNKGCVLACSALKESYRQTLAKKNDIFWVVLHGDYELILQRMARREGHYMPPKLLQSQFETLEVPQYGLSVDIIQSKEVIVKRIMDEFKKPAADIGLLGLGVMGSNLALNLLDNGHRVSVFNRDEGAEKGIVAKFLQGNPSQEKLAGFTKIPDFIASLGSPKVIFLMITAGPAIDSVVATLLPFLSENDIIIDGGNSHYTDTNRRFESLTEKGIRYIGCGISGGEEGARYGCALMPGGDKNSYLVVQQMLESIAARDTFGNRCCAYIGKAGAGHFVKMVHNGIEYAEMQLIAEVYHFLRQQISVENIVDVFEAWAKTDLRSYLLEITVEILKTRNEEGLVLDSISDRASGKGTGIWSVKAAADLNKVVSTMNAALNARFLSDNDTMRDLFNSDSSKKISEEKLDLDSLKQTYASVRLINHIQGLKLITTAGETYQWDLNLAEICRVWTNGCIIRSELMETLSTKLKTSNYMAVVEDLGKEIEKFEEVFGSTVTSFISNKIPCDLIASAWNYWIAVNTDQLPTNLIQAQRDYFGGHGYQLADDLSGKKYHFNWKKPEN